MPARSPRHRQPTDLLALMEPWPKSWAGAAQDEPTGSALVAVLRPFMLHLEQQQLSRKTLRRHLDNLWLIGGEIIRKLYDDPPLRKQTARTLLLEAVAGGQAPWVSDLTAEEQAALDATARKLFRFLH